MKNTCIGLFGTCDNIRWRDSFMKEYAERNIEYFNPMVDNWDPSLAAIEAKHLDEDGIILFPILKDSYGLGSLAEVGFSILKASQNNQRSFVFLVEPEVSEALKVDAALAKASNRTRALVRAHLDKLTLPNVHVVETLEAMLKISLKLIQL